MRSVPAAPVLIGIAILVILASLSCYTVDQREIAVVFQLGEIREVVAKPGLHVKWPLIQNVRTFDNRILTLDTPDTERFITSEKKNVLVDSFVKWRIADVRQFYISVQGDEQRAQLRISQTVNSALKCRSKLTICVRPCSDAMAQMPATSPPKSYTMNASATTIPKVNTQKWITSHQMTASMPPNVV